MINTVKQKARQSLKQQVLWMRRQVRDPWATPADRKLILHGTHHKMGTVWLGNVLGTVATHFGLNAIFSDAEVTPQSPPQSADLFLQAHSQFNLPQGLSFVGTHMVRDPRDVAVSGYKYHLWTDESWANRPMKEFASDSPARLAVGEDAKVLSMTYRQYLNTIDPEQGLEVEIKNLSHSTMAILRGWDFADPRFFEFKYEQLIADEDAWFEKIFLHYGFSTEAVNKAVDIARQFSIKRVQKTPGENARSHIRSGKSGQWEDQFTERHKALFKTLNNDLLEKMGYVENDSW
ncbi:MAG: sulfotransferase domain-containing protein [Planctomycetota bacterium]